MQRIAVGAACAVLALSCRSPDTPEAPEGPYQVMARHIVEALAPADGERALVRHDLDVFPGLGDVVAEHLEARGVDVRLAPYGEAQGFHEALEEADIYVWLPTGLASPHPPEQERALILWLDAERGRQVHFHWGAGTVAEDGLAGEHSPAYDSVYLAALAVDRPALHRRQSAAAARLRDGRVRVTTPAGTDVAFELGDRPFNLQDGDASASRMEGARIRIDREVELPPGVIRVAPVEETVQGVVVVPWARFGADTAVDLRITFQAGRAAAWTASSGEEAFRAALAATPALARFREFTLGFSPLLVAPPDAEWLPYYGYGAGVVRLSLGDNTELGGAVRGGGSRWFFFRDATVTVDGDTLVSGGELRTPPPGGGAP